MPKVIRTISATPLERVTIEKAPHGGAHVWLRRNIIETTAETEGATMPIWEADEIYYWWPEAPSIADVEADFDTLWAGEVIDQSTEARIACLERAFSELVDLTLGGE